MDSLESRIGYQFTNRELLVEALTHASLSYETKEAHADNQRLEFLGDAVLQLVLTDALFRRFPELSEGPLTKLRSRLVSRDALRRCALEARLGEALRLGRGEESSGGRKRASNLADAVEALIGAVYLDGGIESARSLVQSLFADLMEEVVAEPDEKNPKGELQEALQALGPEGPSYAIVAQEGPDHQKSFVAEARWRDRVLGRGTGASKKQAEAEAAAAALKESRWLETLRTDP